MGCSAAAEQVVGLRLLLCRRLFTSCDFPCSRCKSWRPATDAQSIVMSSNVPSLGSRRESHFNQVNSNFHENILIMIAICTDPSLPALAGNGQP